MQNWAFLIGIDKYQHQNRLRNAVADARLVSRILSTDYGFDRSKMIHLYDEKATRSRILRVINHVIANKWRVQRQDQLFVFFAGHGGRAKKGRRSTWFLAPSDGKRVSERPANWDTVLTSTDIRSLETQFRGAHIFYVFDCCHAGMAFSYQVPSTRPASLVSVHALVAGRERDTVNDEAGTGHSIFTESLSEALGGWGGLGEGQNNSFNASDLINFIRRDVPDQIKRKHLHPVQRPFGGPLGGNTEGREFTFAPVLPRLPNGLVGLLLNSQVAIRQEGVRQLGQLSDAELTEVKVLALSRMAQNASPSVRTEVAFQLGPDLGPRALSLLITMLADRDEHVLFAVLISLSNMRKYGAEVIPHVTKLLTHHSPRVRRSAQSCLALLGVRKALDAVVAQLPTEQGSIRREIIAVLKKLPKTEISKEVLTRVVAGHLRDKEWRSRRAAAEAIGELGLSDAVDPLIRLAGSLAQHYLVRYAAVEALGHLGEPSARETVFGALIDDRSLLVRTAAGEAAGSLNGHEAVGYLTHVMATDLEWRVRRAAVESCGLLRNGAAIQPLVHTATDPHFRVRMAVAQALGEIGDDAGRDALTEMASSDRSLFVKRAAERALQRL